MSDNAVTIVLDPAEQHIVTAALLLYEAHLSTAEALGGDARETAEAVGPISRRVQRRLFDAMYGPDGEPPDPIDLAKWETDRLADGDHFAGMSA